MSDDASRDTAEDAGDAGFALAEALVAFAILALVSLAMMRAFSGTAVALSTTAAREARLDLAERLVEQVRAQDPIRLGRSEGTDEGQHWWIAVEPVESAGLPAPDGTPRLFRLSVGVAAKTPPSPPLLTTLVLARGAQGG